MPKFFETPEFKKLNEEWRKKLELADFEDQEDEWGFLKQLDSRGRPKDMKSWEAFYSKLGQYLDGKKSVPPFHRRVLELYCEGVSEKEICEKLRCSRSKAQRIIVVYREIILEETK